MIKNDYKNAQTSGSYRVFDIVDSSGTTLYSNVHLVDKSTYTEEGDTIGANDINEIADAINDNTTDVAKLIEALTNMFEFDQVNGVLKIKPTTEI